MAMVTVQFISITLYMYHIRPNGWASVPVESLERDFIRGLTRKQDLYLYRIIDIISIMYLELVSP